MGTYPASDGLVNLAAPTQRMWQRLCDALDADALFADERFLRRARSCEGQGCGESRDQRSDASASRSCRTGGAAEHRGCALRPDQYDRARRSTTRRCSTCSMAKPAAHAELGDINLVRSPINLSAFPAMQSASRVPPPTRENTRQAVLRDFGFVDTEVEALVRAGAI